MRSFEAGLDAARRNKYALEATSASFVSGGDDNARLIVDMTVSSCAPFSNELKIHFFLDDTNFR